MSIGSVFNCNNTSDFILTLVDLVKIFQRTKYFLRTVKYSDRYEKTYRNYFHNI